MKLAEIAVQRNKNVSSGEHQAGFHDGSGQVDSSRVQQQVGGKHGHAHNQPSPNKKIRLGSGRQDMNSISLKKRNPGNPSESPVIIRGKGAHEDQQSRRMKYAIVSKGKSMDAKDQDNYLRDDMIKATLENTSALNQIQPDRNGSARGQGDSKQTDNFTGHGGREIMFTKEPEIEKTMKRNDEARAEVESISKESGVQEQRGDRNYEGSLEKMRQVNRQDNYNGNEKEELGKDMGTVQPVFERTSRTQQQETADPDMGKNASNSVRYIDQAMPKSGQVSKQRQPESVNGTDQQKFPSLPVSQQGSLQVFERPDYVAGLSQQDCTESSRMQPRIVNIQATDSSERESRSIKRPVHGNKTVDYVPRTLVERNIEGAIQSCVNSNDFTPSKEVDGEAGSLCQAGGFKGDGPTGFGQYNQGASGTKELHVEMDGYQNMAPIKKSKQTPNNQQPQHGLG